MNDRPDLPDSVQALLDMVGTGDKFGKKIPGSDFAYEMTDADRVRLDRKATRLFEAFHEFLGATMQADPDLGGDSDEPASSIAIDAYLLALGRLSGMMIGSHVVAAVAPGLKNKLAVLERSLDSFMANVALAVAPALARCARDESRREKGGPSA